MGNLPSPTLVPLHPDTRAHLKYPADYCEIQQFEASPTASGRTVHVHGVEPFHLKLHYEGTIGRLNRSLGVREASYAVHVSEQIETLVRGGGTPPSFGILPERYAVVTQVEMKDRLQEVGAVYRTLTPTLRCAHPAALIPGFSLFSQDRQDPAATQLVLQICSALSEEPKTFLLDRLLFPLIDSYFSLLLGLGIQGEFHAQNVLFGIDENGAPTSVVLRDMESADTDLSLQNYIGIASSEPPSQHKCLTRAQANYQIKHSFMYDHKLGEYLISPLIQSFAVTGLVDRDDLEKAVRQRAVQYIAKLPYDFFPTNGWYSFDKIQIDRTTSARPYVCRPDVRFRN